MMLCVVVVLEEEGEGLCVVVTVVFCGYVVIM